MSACPMMSYNNVSQAVWTCIVATVANYGINVRGNSGTASAHGFTVHWNYNPANGSLQVQCTAKPFFVSCGTVNSHLNDAVSHCLGQNNSQVSQMVATGGN
jgi:hypothetical protein